MRLALVGGHPDGLDIARALVQTGRHELAVVAGPRRDAGEEMLRRAGLTARVVTDLEEVLADPLIEVVIVAGPLSVRDAQLRRALQSERHVLCVYPPHVTPDIAYEATLIQQDTRCVLLPLLVEPLHPALQRLADWARSQPGGFRLLQLERWSPGPIVREAGDQGTKPTFLDWSVLRAVGGEITEVAGFASREEAVADEPLLLTGKFERGGLFQASLLPSQREPRWRLLLLADSSRAELNLPQGWPGPAVLRWTDETGSTREESLDAWDPWPSMAAVVEAAIAQPAQAKAPFTWQDAIRCLELDDAARRSTERRRSSTLEYQEVSEAVGFKGTMTLVGCAMLWFTVFLLILSAWEPRIGWVILPLIAFFLIMQLFRWVIPGTVSPREQQKNEGT